MPIIILIPFVICVIALFRTSVQKVFLDLYLPVLLLLPLYYYCTAPSLPGIDFSETVLLPIGIALLLKELPRWRFTPIDLAMVFFIYSACHADELAGRHVVSIFNLFDTLLQAGVPYAIGKLLIEQPAPADAHAPTGRVATARRFVFLLFIACIISAYEYRMGQNPFMRFFNRFFPGEHFAWKTQIRWGFGRVSGPYGQSELAGIVLLTGIVLTLWLAYCHFWEPKFRLERVGFRRHPFTKGAIIAWAIGITLLMTQARGPWLGCIFAVPVAFIGRSAHTLRRAVLTLVFLVVIGGSAYVGLKNYTSGAPTSAEQQTAEYRQALLDNYIPIAQKGGAWGWGQHFPEVAGQGSIDNEYLFIALTQGWVGLLTFSLIALGSVGRLVWAAAFSSTRGDRYFCFSLLGIFVGLLITLVTVFLGLQPYQLFFLLAGWSQAIRPTRAEDALPTFEHVYT